MLRYLIPLIAWRDIPAMLTVAIVGAVIAGVYGVLHDQVTYTISPEYFTNLKFSQFAYADFGGPRRVFVAEIGFLATWWVGFFSGWFLARKLIPLQPRDVAIRKIAVGFGIIFFNGLACGLLAFAYGWWLGPTADYSAWRPLLDELKITNEWAFIRVAHIHTGSYLGGLIGFLLALGLLRRESTASPAVPCPSPDSLPASSMNA